MNTWLLLFSLFCPRISLWIAWMNGQIPQNDVPFAMDAFLAIIAPRLLMLYYIYLNLGFGVWFWVHLVMAILVGVEVKKKVK